ncbi:MAG: NADH-quinone oxidoreductase subunit NuoG [Gammaproteobacteria bacterium]|nr:NADH-quinone oxidoreductase subunit NuoG [Gammaproteobacteria bacterium]MDH4255674.1 NADH-quinone oxidoreductase subunit NuoG [Gammaproteobacteria bacterium]MDH5311307.1 NADH-quinone oxidoreductase subunit NuoG [Gammaproteobacteria bacterium]
MSDDMVNLEVDGRPVQARKGQMIIEVTDAVGAYVPRFCYHEKLSIAANCRMCLVQVEKAPKPLPACATPVGEGMKIFTRSPYAIAAQKATMEFLLINHPLDCPICDQGGECELQDLAMGYGRDVSRYTEKKRVVKDKDIGPLVSTDMTRCIHCTRCVRFGQEIAGIPELGTTHRGENMKISTYIEKSIDHELSANIIDLCPVGALNNKPYRYSARAWEIEQRATVAPHDCVGSNIYAHVLRGTVKRIVPRPNEAVNETWISDRDRFSYEAIYSADRLTTPRVRENGEWRDTDWESALKLLAEKLQAAGKDAGILLSPSSTTEEAYLLAKIAGHLGSPNIDHRLRRQDFSDQDNDPEAPLLGLEIAALEQVDGAFVVGSSIRREAPILAHRLRKAALRGARVSFACPEPESYHFGVHEYLSDAGLLTELAGVAAAAGCASNPSVRDLLAGVSATAAQQRVAASLSEAGSSVVLLGAIAERHPAAAALRTLAAAIAGATDSALGYVSEGANSVGASLAGALPHREAGGAARGAKGRCAAEIATGKGPALLLFGAEPGPDVPAFASEKRGYGFVAACTPFRSDALEASADLLLPVGTFAETSGTYVNCEGRWQSFAGVARPVGEARPGWKVLRVLGNLLDAPDFDYENSEEVRDELSAHLGSTPPKGGYAGGGKPVKAGAGSDDARRLDVPMYQVDGLVRRATALQRTPEAIRGREGC